MLEDICEQSKIYLGEMKVEGVMNLPRVEEQKKKIEKSDYLIEYITAKNLLCVKYVTDI